MSAGRKPPSGAPAPHDPTVTHFNDHDVIVPDNALRKAWSRRPARNAADPVAAAEAALAALSDEFAGWMESECARLDAARHAVETKGFDTDTRDALFHAAHDIKGEAATLGFPLAAAAAKSLCRLIEKTPDARRIPLLLVEQHVDAIRAIVREHAHRQAEEIARTLTLRLREVTDAFLRDVNGGVLEDDDDLGPPTVPHPGAG